MNGSRQNGVGVAFSLLASFPDLYLSIFTCDVWLSWLRTRKRSHMNIVQGECVGDKASSLLYILIVECIIVAQSLHLQYPQVGLGRLC